MRLREHAADLHAFSAAFGIWCSCVLSWKCSLIRQLKSRDLDIIIVSCDWGFSWLALFPGAVCCARSEFLSNWELLRCSFWQHGKIFTPICAIQVKLRHAEVRLSCFHNKYPWLWWVCCLLFQLPGPHCSNKHRYSINDVQITNERYQTKGHYTLEVCSKKWVYLQRCISELYWVEAHTVLLLDTERQLFFLFFFTYIVIFIIP